MKSTILRKEMLDRSVNVLNIDSDLCYNKLDSNPVFLFQLMRVIFDQTNKIKREIKNAN